MHERMVAALPEDLREQADRMHARMDEHMTGTTGVDPAGHGAHHADQR